MTVLLAIVTFVGVLAVAVARALAVDEIKGRVQAAARSSVERTISALPAELQAEWADEWRAELAAVITMPLSAAQYARGLRRSAHELLRGAGLQPDGAVADGASTPSTRTRRALVTPLATARARLARTEHPGRRVAALVDGFRAPGTSWRAGRRAPQPLGQVSPGLASAFERAITRIL